MAVLDSFVTLILSFIHQTLAGEWCTDYSSSGDLIDWSLHVPGKFYCETSCCGNKMNRHCCWGLSRGAIVWLVIGSILGVSIIVGTIIAIYCCCRRQPGDQGHAMGPENGLPVATTATAMAFAGPGTGMSYIGPGGVRTPHVLTASGSNSLTYPAPPPAYPGAYDLGLSQSLSK